MQKKVKERILDIMADTPNISRDEVVKLIRTYGDTLDIHSLVEKEYRAKANRLMSSFRDERGIREVFAIKDDDDLASYVNIAKCKELKDLEQIKKRLEGNIRGNSTSLRKVESRIYLASNQQTIRDTPKAIKNC